MKLFSFIYFLNEDIGNTQKFLGKHVTYWKSMKFEYFKNGPFADKSGGLIIYSSGSLEMAREIVANDPLILGNAVKQDWVKEWIA
jgi:uncharacterized protein YciI